MICTHKIYKLIFLPFLILGRKMHRDSDCISHMSGAWRTTSGAFVSFLKELIMSFMWPPWKEKATRKYHCYSHPRASVRGTSHRRLDLGWRRRQNWPYKIRDSCHSVLEPRVKEHAVAGPIQCPERCQDLWCGGIGCHRTEHWVSKPRDACQIAQYSCPTRWQRFSE